jgi:two-component system sensor histidine kinase CpxA
MKSLFLRLLTFMWLAMTLLVGVFALIHAYAFPPEAGEQRQKFLARAAQTRGENALWCQQLGRSGCERALSPRDARDQRLALYRNGQLLLGQDIAGAAELLEQAQSSPERMAFRAADTEITAALLEEPGYAVLAEGPLRSRWMFFLVPDTLPYRLAAIVLVTGLVSLLLARYLSKPIAQLRLATQ